MGERLADTLKMRFSRMEVEVSLKTHSSVSRTTTSESVQSKTQGGEKTVPKIPVDLSQQKTEVEPLDETIPYTGIIRKVGVSDHPDVNGSFFLTGGVVEINELEEWKGRSAYFNYI